MICGVDEAGKGPVMGPLVVAAVVVDNAKEIENLGIRDSKLLTKTKRKELAEMIKEKFTFAVEIIEPKLVDEYRRKNKLNDLNREAFGKLISKLDPNIAYVDAADVNEQRFGVQIKPGLPQAVFRHHRQWVLMPGPVSGHRRNRTRYRARD